MSEPMQLIQRLHQHARERGDAPAYIDVATGEAVSWIQLNRRVAAAAQLLLHSLGSPGNSVVPIRISNTVEFPIAFFAALSMGYTPFPLSPESPDWEPAEMALKTEALMMIGDAGIGIPGGVISVQSLLQESEPAEAIHISPDETGLMLLSSGSTGTPKIVCRSFASVDAVCEQMCRAIGITSKDRVLATVPLCHSYGIEHGLLAPVWAGATTHLMRGLDLPLIQRELLESNITLLPGVPSMYEMLANLSTHGQRYPALRAAYSAGAPLPAAVADRFYERCGVRIGQLFGATEIGSVTYADAAHPHFDPASVGQPMPGVKIRITDDQLWVSTPSMFSGYLHEEASQIVDGFYPTGDLARLDEHGNLFITGRAKLLIDVGGLKVNPLEVERVLLKHAGVGDCVVIPVQQSETVVRLKAIIVPRVVENPPSIEELRQFSRDRLAAYKVPRLFEMRDSLPRTETGKILRKQVET